MKKDHILSLILDRLAEDLAVIFKAAKTAHEASIHEENVPDNEYDTLSLEASYLAQAQANRAQEIKGALEAFRGLSLREFNDNSPIRLTALVTLEAEDGARKTVFIGPQAGGLKLDVGGREIIVITPHSPVGRELIGKIVGDPVELPGAGREKGFEIVEVC